jgi:hypothetical protein
MGKLVLLWLAAIYILNADSLPIHPDLPVKSSELDRLSSLEGKLSRSASDMMKGLHGAEATTDAGPSRRLGEGRSGAGRGAGGTAAERVAQKARLQAELEATEASIHQMEAGAGSLLVRDQKIGQMAMYKAVAAEQRREARSYKTADKATKELLAERTRQAAWAKHMDASLQQVESHAALESNFDQQALQIENGMTSHSRAGTQRSSIKLPFKELKHSEKTSSNIKSQLGELESRARQMRHEIEQATPSKTKVSLGESPESVQSLKSQLKDAQATKQMLERNAMHVVRLQHRQEHEKIRKTVSKMRTDFSNKAPVQLNQVQSELQTEEQKDRQLREHSHKNLRWMEQVTAHVQQGASHQFAEFNSILESSHSTRHKADKQLTDLEAMMTALKTKRSLRLQGEV